MKIPVVLFKYENLFTRNLHKQKLLFILGHYPKHLFTMTLYQFNTSDEMEQLEAIWEYGVVVAEPDDETYHYKLYQIDAFYVEEVWHKEYNVRRAFNSFASTNAEMLKPYLDGIGVRRVFN